MWRSPLRITLIASLLWGIMGSVSPLTAYGEVTEALLLQRIREARQQGASISNDEVQDIITRFRERKERRRQMTAESEVRLEDGGTTSGTPPDLSKPLSRVLGEEGIPFPQPEEVILKPSPTSPPLTSDAPTPAPLWSPEPYRAPQSCEMNEMKRVVIYGDADESEVMYDKLFLPKDLVPLDPAEVFGAEVTLEPYRPALDGAVLKSMEFYKVPCLPYRIRRTRQAEYHLFGAYALRFYQGIPTGKERPHPFIQQKLHSGTQPRR